MIPAVLTLGGTTVAANAAAAPAHPETFFSCDDSTARLAPAGGGKLDTNLTARCNAREIKIELSELVITRNDKEVWEIWTGCGGLEDHDGIWQCTISKDTLPAKMIPKGKANWCARGHVNWSLQGDDYVSNVIFCRTFAP